MIQGLRALPWIQHAREQNRYLLDCATCQENNSHALRRDMGCGWITEENASPASVWQHPGDESPRPDTCSGYTTELPDVIDAASCFLWFEKNQLAIATGTEDPPAALVSGIEILHCAAEAFRGWRMTPERDR